MKNIELEKKIAHYLNRVMTERQYNKMVDWMGEDKDKFNRWVIERDE